MKQEARPPKSKIIGIGGGLVGGKTSLSDLLVNFLGAENSLIVKVDARYLENSERFPRATSDGDILPIYFVDVVSVSSCIDALSGVDNSAESLQRASGQLEKSFFSKEKEPKPFVFIEGNSVVAIPEMRNLCDFVIFVDTPKEPLNERYMISKEHEQESVFQGSEWDRHEQIAHRRYFYPSRHFADLVIDGTCSSKDDIELIWGSVCAAIF